MECVYHDHIARVYKNPGIAISDRGGLGTGKIDVVGDLFDVKQIGVGGWSDRLRPGRPVLSEFEDGSPGQGAAHHGPEEIPPRWMWM